MVLDSIKLSVVFDNESCSSNLTSLWGFSCFIETNRGNTLFDTGSNGRVLLKNLKAKGLDVKSIDNIFISHAHWDHIGGLDSILELNPSVNIFVTSHISKNLIRDLKSLSKSVTIIEDRVVEILKDIYSTGALGEYGEQSLIIDMEDGLIIIAGCAHSGIENIIKRAKEHFNRDILLVIGGFHLHNRNKRYILDIIESMQELNVKYISPSHCTGAGARELFRDNFGKNYIEGGVGVNIEFKKGIII